MNDSTKNYLQLVSTIDDYTRAIDISPDQRDRFIATVRRSRKIIVTGTGTSLPTAQYLADRLRRQFPEKPVYFLPTGKAIREIDHLESDDLVIIISYGLNRADSLIMLNKAIDRCAVVTLSGNPELDLGDNQNIVIPPDREKIFCRPISPLTTLMAIEYLCGGTKSASGVIDSVGIHEDLCRWIDPKKQTIILYTAGVSYAAELWGIVLREGAGMNVSTKDVENYSHGYYGPDTAHLRDRQYIILNSDSREDTRDLDRAKGLYSIDNFNSYIVVAKGDTYQANAQLFREATEVVSRILVDTGYDMYGPNGMDNNRRYHEYEHFTDY